MFASTVFESSEEPTLEMPVVAAASEPERRRWEKDLLGLYVTQSPLSDPIISEQLAANVDDRIIALEEVHTGQTLTVGGIVSNVRSFMTRKGHAMGAVTLEDPPESIEVICFPRIWERIAPDLENDRVVIASGRSEGDDNSPRMLADNIYALSTVEDTESNREIKDYSSASVQSTTDARGVDDYAAGVLRFGDKTLATFTCGMTLANDWTTYIAGDEGEIAIHDPWLGDGTFTLTRDGQVETIEARTDTPLYALEAEAFAEAIAGAKPWITRDDTLGNMRVLDQLREQAGVPVPA